MEELSVTEIQIYVHTLKSDLAMWVFFISATGGRLVWYSVGKVYSVEEKELLHLTLRSK